MGIPIELLRGSPTAEMIAHEVGHLVTSLELNRTGTIQFYRDGEVIGAITWNTNYKLGARDIALRALAGITTQAIVCPLSVSDRLRSQLLEGSLFASSRCLHKRSAEHLAMHAHYSWTDWDIILDQKRTLKPNPRVHLNEMHGDLLAYLQQARTKQLIFLLIQDISNWLKEDSEDCTSPDWISYCGARINNIFAANPRGESSPPFARGE